MIKFPLFKDRTEAGQRLGAELVDYAGRPNVQVLALPRGGVSVGYEVARALNVRMDIFMVRKLGVPGAAEFAMGALATGGVRILDDHLMQALGVPDQYIRTLTARGTLELERRERLYRGGHPQHVISDQTAILVDDGMATGSTMRAAVKGLRLHLPSKIVVAIPVAAASACENLKALADELICVAQPEPFQSVGEWYEDFDQVTDDDVRDLLELAWSHETSLVGRHGPDTPK
jgi:predicted phosphoribosyltransferase